MSLANTGLVLEGGGLRGVYTSGVLHFFMDQGLWFPYVIGVSMGACNAANYISRQPKRNRIVNISFINEARYLSYRRLLTGGELFGMDFIFDTIPNSLELFDYNVFYNNPAKCITTVTNCISGEAEYFEKNELGADYMKLLRASSSLPFIAKPVKYRDAVYMDGGMSDSIPIRKSIADGNAKNVIILTQPVGYRKKPEPLAGLAKLRYPHLKGLQRALATRHNNYNETIELIEQSQKDGSVFVIQPKEKLIAGRVERDKDKLHVVYDQGYRDAKEHLLALRDFLGI